MNPVHMETWSHASQVIFVKHTLPGSGLVTLTIGPKGRGAPLNNGYYKPCKMTVKNPNSFDCTTHEHPC